MSVLLSWLQEALLGYSLRATPKSIHFTFFEENQLTRQNIHLEPSTKPPPPIPPFLMVHTREAHLERGHLVP